MRILKLVSAIIAVLTFTAVATATASAAEILWNWLPGAEGTKVTGKSGKPTLQIKGGGAITCKESSATGEIQKEQTLLLILEELGSCTVAGITIESLGDKPGTVLLHWEIHDCLIAPGDLGLLYKLLPLHLEVPSTKLLITLEGAIIELVNPSSRKAKTFNLMVEQKEAKQAIEKCEGGTVQTLLTSLDGGTFVQTGKESAQATLEFATEQEVME